MSSIKVSREDLVDFSRIIYSKALNSHKDLEDSICLMEADIFYEKFRRQEEISLNDLTLSTSSEVCWSYSHTGNSPPYSLNTNPCWPVSTYTVSASYDGFSPPFFPSTPPFNPVERQLLLFKDLGTTNSSNNEDFNDSLNGELFSSEPEGNEGHIFFLGGDVQ